MWGSSRSHPINESSLVGVSGRTVNCGDIEGDIIVFEEDINRNKVFNQMNVGNVHVIVIPQQKNTPTGLIGGMWAKDRSR